MTLLNRVVLGAGVVVAISGAVWQQAPRRQQVRNSNAGEECPHYWGADGHGPLPYPDTIPVAGPSTNYPEYNDCQRFLVPSVNGTMKYGDVQAVWVRFNIKNWMNNPHPVPIPVRPVGTVVAPGSSPYGANVTGSTRVTVVGVIYSRGDYAPLGIKRGFDCIVLRWDNIGGVVNPATYKGWMVPVSSFNKCGTEPLSINVSTGTPLSVTSLSPASSPAGPDAVPEVSRFDWDSTHKVQYVSMWCPTGWCEFHQASFTESPRYALPATMANVNRSVIRQKGWYDEQILADPTSAGTTSGIAPSLVRGTLFPVPDLASRTVPTYRGKWQQVAWVSFDRDDAKYKSKFMYERDPAPPNGSSDNTISMCFETKGDRAMLATDPNFARAQRCADKVPPRCTLDTKNDGFWYMRIQSTSGRSKDYCVFYRPAPFNVKPPGVVRWRWTLKDETVWISCPMGCCEGDAIGP